MTVQPAQSHAAIFYLIKSIMNSSNCINILGDYLYSDTNYGFF